MVRIFSFIATSVLALVLIGSAVHAADGVEVATPRGAPIRVIVQGPDGPGPFPAVVLGPGTGTLRQAINDAVAAKLQKDGFVVYRFDWAYYVKDKAALPSDIDRAPEIEDFTTVVGLARADKRVDPTRIVVGGKSRGTIIAWRVLRADPDVKAILQLTPVCTKAEFTASQLYPDLDQEARPSLWLSGDADPACRTASLYGFLASAKGKARAAILRGDHGLGLPDTSELAASLASDFAKTAVAEPRPDDRRP